MILAGILYAALPIHTLFFLVGGCFILSGVSETFIRCDRVIPEGRLTLRAAFRDMGDGVRYLRTQKAILALLGAILFINFFFSPVTGNFIPYFVRTDLQPAPSFLFDSVLTPEMWSSVFSACFGVSSLIGAAILSARPQADKCGFRVALRLCAIALVMIGATACYWLTAARGTGLNFFLIAFCLCCLAIGALISWINIPVTTAVMRAVNRDKLSKVNSIISIGSQGMIPLASVLAGAVLNMMGSAALLTVCSLGFTVTAALLMFSRPVRDL